LLRREGPVKRLVSAFGFDVGFAPMLPGPMLLDMFCWNSFHMAMLRSVSWFIIAHGVWPSRPPIWVRNCLLLVEEDLHRPFQVVAHEALQRIAVETDDLAEQLRGEHRFAVGLVLRDDLQQHLAGKVIAGLGIAHLEILAVDDELAHILDGDVAGDLGVVETTVGILLDDADRTHRAPTLNRVLRSMAQGRLPCNSPRSCAVGHGRPG
jgi:hypothetical protein